MTTLRLTAALAVGIIVWTAGPAMAQDQGKTEAAKLVSESRAALQNLYAGVPLAKELGKTAAAILVFPSVTKAGLGIGGQYRRGYAVERRCAGGLLQDHGRVRRVAGRSAELRLCDVFRECGCRRGPRRREGLRSWCRPEHRGGGRGHGEEQYDRRPLKSDVYAFIFFAEGPDGRPWHPGQQDHEDHAEVTLQPCISVEVGEGIGLSLHTHGTEDEPFGG